VEPGHRAPRRTAHRAHWSARPDGREVWPGDAREAHGFNWEVVQSFAIGNLQEALAAAEKIPALSGEGFVVCDANFARVKIKSTQYVALHHLRTSFSLRRMIDVARSNEGAEFLAYFPDFAPQYEDVRARYEGIVARCEADYERIRGAQSQRDFAEVAKACEVPAALFAMRNGKASSAREFFERALISPLLGWLGLREAAAREEEARRRVEQQVLAGRIGAKRNAPRRRIGEARLFCSKYLRAAPSQVPGRSVVRIQKPCSASPALPGAEPEPDLSWNELMAASICGRSSSNRADGAEPSTA
jgi:hypothetical protein